ncbi:hypothetical protein GURASL_25090 [Geotalea uraniireducens]|uniref:SdpI family protein n=1 Tax=Geotalea uraniireducens TaxID=351604 RepID=A0ABM8ENH6_9BACT|nr:SdpI family protein [Geotalea uraniireducens]BDV43586.1 hypothetical protein GURASL_25090 [Geotalea uraniireducens]
MTTQPFSLPALLIAVAAIPLIGGMVPPNRWYGIRTARTLADRRVWYRANRFGGWAFLLASVVYLLVAVICPTAGAHDADFSRWLLHLAAFALPLLAGAIATGRHIRQL